MPKTYLKRPVTVEALQWTGDNLEALEAFVGDDLVGRSRQGALELSVRTLEGPLDISMNDWIIRGIKGEFYPCKPDIFAELYDEVVGPRELDEWVDSYDSRRRIKVGDKVTRAWGYHRGTAYGTVTRIWQPKPGSRWRLEIKSDEGQTETWRYASDCKVLGS